MRCSVGRMVLGLFECLGNVLASDAHSPGLKGCVLRLLGVEQVHVRLTSCRRCSSYPGSPLPGGAAQTSVNGSWWGPSGGARHSPLGRRF